MIVIVIMGVIYTLAISKLHSVAQQKESASFAHLKEYLHSFITEDAKSARLLCLDDCSECSVYVDGIKGKNFESFFDSSVEVYRYDFLHGAVAVEPIPFFNKDNVQKRVCFSFEVDKNLISDQVMIVYKKRAYDYTSYFTPTKIYDSLSTLVDAKEAKAQEVSR
jgi:hypothetical protein